VKPAKKMRKDEAKEPSKRTAAEEARESRAYQLKERRLGIERHKKAAARALKGK
jgi:hypothetical protein